MVRDQVRDKLTILFEDMGEQQVKNIARPVRAYRVVTDVAAPAAISAVRRRVPRRVIAAGIAAVLILAAGAAAFWRLHPPQPAATVAGAPMAPPALPDKPSIAVLPFANLSGDPAQDYLADGLTDNLLDALAQNPGYSSSRATRPWFIAARRWPRGRWQRISASATCWKAACRNRATAYG